MGSVEKMKHKIFNTHQLVYWQYSDNAYLSAVRRNSDGRCLYAAFSKDEKEFARSCAKARKDCMAKKGIHIAEKPVKLKVPAGLKYYAQTPGKTATLISVEEQKRGFENLTLLLEEHAQLGDAREILSLVSLVLSGYIARQTAKKLPTEGLQAFERAPVVRVVPHRDVFWGGWEILTEIMLALAVPVNGESELRLTNPVVLPSQYCANDIEQCSYATLKGDKSHTRFPTVYRETSALVHSAFFRKSQLDGFIDRNRWASVFLFHYANTSNRFPMLEIDLNEMKLGQPTWERMPIYNLMRCFVLYLSQKTKGKDGAAWLASMAEAAREVTYHARLASVHPDIKRAQGKQFASLKLQLMTLRSFLSFSQEREIISHEQFQELWVQWCNILLPGSTTMEILQKNEAQKAQQQAEHVQTIRNTFEEILGYLLDPSVPHAMKFVPNGVVCASDPKYDLSNGPWVFLSWMNPKGDDAKRVIKITRRAFIWAWERKNPNGTKDYANDVWKYINKLEKLPTYIHSAQNVSLKFSEESKTVSGITILAEKLDFLDHKVKNAILGLYPVDPE